MHDRAVRRRRAVLVVLVAASLFLLTAYYGESSNGQLHSVQRGAMTALAPIQEGASRVLKPFRDLFGWFGDTIHAKSQRDALRKQVDGYRLQLAERDQQLAEARQQAGLKQVDTTGGMDQYAPVNARVYLHSPSVWYQSVTINKGSDAGVETDDPVINGAGLVGRVAAVTGGQSVVTLITDKDFAAAGVTADTREPGSITPSLGTTGDLLFDLVDNVSKVHTGDLIVTAGTTDSRLQSPFPAGIPIGTVKRIDLGSGDLDPRIHITPAADVRRLDMVQVLTRPHANLTASVK
jgi:rod shape-determining protein MreC